MTFLFGRNFLIFLFLAFLWNSSSLQVPAWPSKEFQLVGTLSGANCCLVCDLILTVAGDNEEGCTEADSIFEGILFIVRII